MSSNHTRVSVREWTEMQQRIAELDAYVVNSALEVSRLHAEAERRRREIAAAREASTRAVNQAAQALADAYQVTLQDLGTGFASEIAAQSSDFRNQLQSMLADARTVSGRLGRSDARVEALAGAYDEAFRARLEQTAQGRERADLVLQELDWFLQQIREMNPEQFMPGDYASLQALRASINASVRAGDYQAAVAVSQSSILSASRVLTQLTLANERFHRQLAEARGAAAAVANRMEELASPDGMISVTVSGQKMEYPYDIAYWSNGDFVSLRRQLSQAEAHLASGRLSMQELAQTQVEIDRIRRQLDRCDQRSRHALASSVFVEDTAVRLHNSLSERGWELVDGGYHANEVKEPYTLQYEDGSGNTVSIVVSPGEKPDEPIYAVEVFSESESHAGMIKDGIHSSVEEAGLRIEEIQCRDDCHLNPTPELFKQNMIEQARRRQRQQ